MTEYSEAHLSAFRAYQVRGHSLDGLTPAQLDALTEDPNFVREIADWRRKAAKPAVPPPAQPPLATTLAAPTDPHRATQGEELAARVLTAYQTAFTNGDTTGWRAIVDEYGETPISLKLLDTFAVHMLLLMNERNRQRQTQIDGLETRLDLVEGSPSDSQKWTTEKNTSIVAGLSKLEQRILQIEIRFSEHVAWARAALEKSATEAHTATAYGSHLNGRIRELEAVTTHRKKP